MADKEDVTQPVCMKEGWGEEEWLAAVASKGLKYAWMGHSAGSPFAGLSGVHARKAANPMVPRAMSISNEAVKHERKEACSDLIQLSGCRAFVVTRAPCLCGYLDG